MSAFFIPFLLTDPWTVFDLGPFLTVGKDRNSLQVSSLIVVRREAHFDNVERIAVDMYGVREAIPWP